LRPEQLDTSRTNAKGIADLKTFLEYAGRGKQALYAQYAMIDIQDHDSIFEEQVSLALQAKGYTIHAQVGCSGYRIDLAVVDQKCPGRYLLGIECDGATYHRSKTARDRDKLREMVLRQLGWQIHRIWSTDWWENPNKEVERIEATIAAARRRISTEEKKVVSAKIRIANPTGFYKTKRYGFKTKITPKPEYLYPL
jgi:Protein of unknown function (DUF559).